jgi:hypothetical protein
MADLIALVCPTCGTTLVTPKPEAKIATLERSEFRCVTCRAMVKPRRSATLDDGGG